MNTHGWFPWDDDDAPPEWGDFEGDAGPEYHFYQKEAALRVRKEACFVCKGAGTVFIVSARSTA